MKRCIFCSVCFLLIIVMAPIALAAPLADGQYSIAVTLTGGSGRAQVESPTVLTAAAGAMTATITWSSPYYEYMLVDGEIYYPVNTEGNARFEIPVLLDAEMAVRAQTIAMSTPHEIDYSLYFDSASLKLLTDATVTPQNTLVIIAVAALVLALMVACIRVVLAKRRTARHNTPK